ncbi:hypothetical protein B0H13DRAFT_1855003 [Mycena leptocephala]|nr:hypothetical protein B0H13DRAFT_1855003 [Mycena leptocephala]
MMIACSFQGGYFRLDFSLFAQCRKRTLVPTFLCKSTTLNFRQGGAGEEVRALPPIVIFEYLAGAGAGAPSRWECAKAIDMARRKHKSLTNLPEGAAKHGQATAVWAEPTTTSPDLVWFRDFNMDWAPIVDTVRGSVSPYPSLRVSWCAFHNFPMSRLRAPVSHEALELGWNVSVRVMGAWIHGKGWATGMYRYSHRVYSTISEEESVVRGLMREKVLWWAVVGSVVEGQPWDRYLVYPEEA